MTDLLARLYNLPAVHPLKTHLHDEGIIIRRPHPAESETIATWVNHHFSNRWAGEFQGAIEHRPPASFIATDLKPIPEPSADAYNLPPEKLIGFACYDIVAKGMFGPVGVLPEYRGRRIGKVLLLACLHAMADDGYGYAVIPWVSSVEFYEKAVGATVIEDSEPGVFRGPLQGL
jgi:ribosomal protein S18 acetylase RimI-like enzyme